MLLVVSWGKNLRSERVARHEILLMYPRMRRELLRRRQGRLADGMRQPRPSNFGVSVVSVEASAYDNPVKYVSAFAEKQVQHKHRTNDIESAGWPYL